MDEVFAALAHRHRRHILDLVKADPGCSVSDVCKHFDVTRIAVMKHVTVLERAGLLLTEKIGRTRHLHLNTVPIQMIHERWTTEYSALWAGRLTGLKYRVEAKTGAKKS